MEALKKQYSWHCPFCEAQNVFAVVDLDAPIPETPEVCVCANCALTFTRTEPLVLLGSSGKDPE